MHMHVLGKKIRKENTKIKNKPQKQPYACPGGEKKKKKIRNMCTIAFTCALGVRTKEKKRTEHVYDGLYACSGVREKEKRKEKHV